jgi:hypothetical protein
MKSLKVLEQKSGIYTKNIVETVGKQFAFLTLNGYIDLVGLMAYLIHLFSKIEFGIITLDD